MIILLFAAAVAVAVVSQVWHRDKSLARIQKGGVLRIGYAVEAPYAFLNTDGRVTGEDPEVARAIASRLGIRHVEWCLEDFGSLINGLNAGQFDLIAAGMFVTPGREKLVAFSRPTLAVHSGLLVQAGNPHKLHSYADIVHDRAVRIAVLGGSVEEAALKQLGVPRERLVQVPDARSGRLLLEAAKVDGLALSAPTLRWMVMAHKNERVELAEPFAATNSAGAPIAQYGAFVFRKQDRALRAAWNRELQKFVGSQAQLNLIRPFGFTRRNLPGSTTNQL